VELTKARVLFTFVGGAGHFHPLVPIARAVADAGHTVAVACQSALVETVEGEGFTAFDTGGDTFGKHERRPLLEVDAEREARDLRDGFARRAARQRAAALLPECERWAPDLLVCDEVDFGTMIVAERLGLPHATVQVLAAGPLVHKEFLADALDEVRAEHGLPPDPGVAMPDRHLLLSPFPPSFRDPRSPLPATAHSLRPADPVSTQPPPPWLADLPDAPTVYFTLGTVFNLESGDLFSRVLDGLRELPVNVVVTVGRHIDPAEFGPQPDHVHIERYVPQSLLLPHCDLVVSHGGSGSVIGALAHGLPVVVVPMGADQPRNGDRCVDLGVGRVVDAVRGTPADVREAVSAVLADPAYRQAAERIRTEIAALPDANHAVPLLEALL
jgi:UDP:flavonoid glycosyltransferase YjiC (YdhE family)